MKVLRRLIPALGAAVCIGATALAGETAQAVRSVRVEKVPVHEPDSPVWTRAPALRVKLIAQNIATPKLTKIAVPYVNVRSVHDGRWIAFLLEWPDKTRDALVDVHRFTDQAAIQLPLDPARPPSFTMGQKGGEVQIIHWKAIWQDDIDKGYRDVQHLHPNYWVDLYWFGEGRVYGEGELAVNSYVRHFKSPEALQFIPAEYVRNPIAYLERREPVEEAMAAGFGTFTSQPRQNAKGRGVWKGGRWRVVIARPLVSEDPRDAPIPPKGAIAFAVWDGAERHIGARKQISAWVPLELAP